MNVVRGIAWRWACGHIITIREFVSLMRSVMDTVNAFVYHNTKGTDCFRMTSGVSRVGNALQGFVVVKLMHMCEWHNRRLNIRLTRAVLMRMQSLRRGHLLASTCILLRAWTPLGRCSLTHRHLQMLTSLVVLTSSLSMSLTCQRQGHCRPKYSSTAMQLLARSAMLGGTRQATWSGLVI